MTGKNSVLDRLSRRINPSSIAEVNVGGEYWPVYLRTHPCNENHVCIGIVLKLKFPETKLLWKLEMPALVCSEAAREQWQFVVDLTEEALEDGDECWRRSKTDQPYRSKFDQTLYDAAYYIGCGQVDQTGLVLTSFIG